VPARGQPQVQPSLRSQPGMPAQTPNSAVARPLPAPPGVTAAPASKRPPLPTPQQPQQPQRPQQTPQQAPQLAPQQVPQQPQEHDDKPWFYGKMSRDGAEKELRGAGLQSGAFLVRESPRAATSFVLSILISGRITHCQVRVPCVSSRYLVWRAHHVRCVWRGIVACFSVNWDVRSCVCAGGLHWRSLAPACCGLLGWQLLRSAATL